MTIDDFNNRYKEQGGIARLRTLRGFQYSRGYIAKNFRVTPSAVKLWGYTFPNEIERLEEVHIKDNMVQFAKLHPLSEFRLAFKGGEHYKGMLKLVKGEIYGK